MPTDDVSDRVRAIVAPSLDAAGLELVDVELVGHILRVTVDRPGGVDLDAVSEASRRISAELDHHDADSDVLPARYVLEVSSPGVERPLRTPEHFRRAIGATVALKTSPGSAGERRVEGVLEAADDTGVVVAGRSIPYAEIERARTRFAWPEPTPRPGQPRRKAGSRR